MRFVKNTDVKVARNSFRQSRFSVHVQAATAHESINSSLKRARTIVAFFAIVSVPFETVAVAEPSFETKPLSVLLDKGYNQQD